MRSLLNIIASISIITFSSLLLSEAHGKSVTAEGMSIIQGGEQASDQQLAEARLSAIADGLRNIAIAQSSEVHSQSILSNLGQLNESVYLKSHLPIQNIVVSEEKRLGGLYRLNVNASLIDEEALSKNNAPQQCRNNGFSLKREVSIELDPTNLPPSALSDDIHGVMLSTQSALRQKIFRSSDLLYTQSDRAGNQFNSYLRSHLIAKRNSNEHTLRISAIPAGDKVTLTLGGYDGDAPEENIISTAISFGKSVVSIPVKIAKTYFDSSVNQQSIVGIRITLPNGGYFTKALNSNNAASLSSTSNEKQRIERWVNKIWPEIDGALSCYPIAAITRKLNQKTLRLSLGSKHGLTKGQNILLMDDQLKLDVSNAENHTSNMGVYIVETLAANHASISPAIGTLPLTDNGKKIVVPF